MSRAARFGAALGASLTQGVAENRRIKEQKARDKLLFTQTLEQIKLQQTNRLAAADHADKLQDDNIKKQQDIESQRNIQRMIAAGYTLEEAMTATGDGLFPVDESLANSLIQKKQWGTTNAQIIGMAKDLGIDLGSIKSPEEVNPSAMMEYFNTKLSLASQSAEDAAGYLDRLQKLYTTESSSFNADPEKLNFLYHTIVTAQTSLQSFGVPSNEIPNAVPNANVIQKYATDIDTYRGIVAKYPTMDEAVEAIDSKGFTDVTGDNIKRLQTVYKVIEEGVDPDSAISQVLAETNKKGFTRDQYRSQLIRDGLSDEAIEVEMGFNFVPDPVDEIYNNVIGDKDIPNEGEVKAKIRTMLDKGYRPETIGSAIEEFKPKRGPATRGSVPEFLDPVTEKLAELAESFRGIEGSAPAGRPSPVAGIGDFIEKKGQEFNENFAKTQQSTILGTMEGLTKRLGESTKKNQKEAELNLTREHEKTVRDRGPKGIGPRLPEADEFNLLNDLFFNLNPSRNP